MRIRKLARAFVVMSMAGGLAVSGAAIAPAVGVTHGGAAITASGIAPNAQTAAHAEDDEHWFTSWAQSIQRRSGLTFTNRTLRQVSRLTQGGDAIRLRLENTFGTAPMTVNQTTVGKSANGPGIVAGTLKNVLFNGSQSVTVPAGKTIWSDPLPFATSAQEDVTISFYLQNATVTTLHDRAGRPNWFAPEGSGNHAANESGTPFNESHGWNYIVGAVDVYNEDLAGTIVAYGSSVVDGSGSESCGPGCNEPDPYMRWTDMVSRNIANQLPEDQQVTLVNAGIGGTTASPACGSGGNDGVSRVSRDVLALHGVTGVIYYYGTNDVGNLGAGCNSESIISSMRATFAELRAAGIKIFVTPVTPRPGYNSTQNAHRADVNNFVFAGGNCSGTCDQVFDFDAALRDPSNSNSIYPPYNQDGLHVNTLGQEAIAQAVPLAPLVAAGAAQITSEAPQAASFGQAYSYELTATGYPAPTFSVTQGALPAGLTLNPQTGIISGVPSSRGRSAFTVTASNGAGTDTLNAVIDVTDKPVFTNATPPAGTVGEPYDFSLQATGFPAPTFTVTAGALPAGLTLDEHSGRILGKPTHVGTHSIKVRAANGVGTQVEATYVLRIAASPSATVLALDDSSWKYGTASQARVIVFASGRAPAGRVELRAGATLVGSGVLINDRTVAGMSTATISIPAGMLPPGQHVLTVRYPGDARLLASSAARSVTVTKAIAKVTAKVAKAKKLTAKKRGTVNVTVAAPGVTKVGGKVVVRAGGAKVGAAKVKLNGKAKVRLKKLKVGKHSLTVTYNGSKLVGKGATAKTTAKVKRQ